MGIKVTIERADGSKAKAEYVRHLRTFTANNSMGGDNRDLDLYRLDSGEEIECLSPANNCRSTPCELTHDIRG